MTTIDLPAQSGRRDMSSLLSGLVSNELVDRVDGDEPVAGISLDSRRLKRGELFIAVPGAQADGRQYVEKAMDSGARAILFESIYAPEECIALAKRRKAIGVTDLRNQVSLIAARFFGFPARQMTVVGITGTNGKTTCVYLITQALDLLGERAAMMGTIGNGPLNDLAEADLTTGDAVETQRTLRNFLDQGATSVCMEVSSHGLEQSRVSAVNFDVAVLTNLTQDHLDYHGTMAQYAAAKRKLFDFECLDAIVINHDDAMGRKILADAHACEVISYGKSPANVTAADSVVDNQGINFTLMWQQQKHEIHSSLLGEINLPNLMATISTLLALGYPLNKIAAVVPKLQSPPGRMELFTNGDEKPSVVVDYSHTPDALEQALLSLRPLVHGKLLVVFGCGGDRDKAKRAVMGEVAARLADYVIVTSDNPRSEDPSAIAAQVVEGIVEKDAVGRYEVILERKQAIKQAIYAAKTEDLVLVAGKGHETVQTVGQIKLPFSDREVVKKILGGSR